MKILHLCLACIYIEGMGYQENILPRKHKELGYDVSVITTYFRNDSKENVYVESWDDDIRIIKIPKIQVRGFAFTPKLYRYIEKEDPGIIFIHGGQFASYWEVVNYKKKHKNVLIYMDNHTDFINTPITSLKNKMVYEIIVGHFVRKLAKYAEKVWGVTPLRVRYLSEVYKVPKEKIGLLEMGGDETKIDFENQAEIRKRKRDEFGISEDDFLIITGGKLDIKKNVELLIKSVATIDFKLVIFGRIEKENSLLKELLAAKNIIWLGWISPDEVYDWYLASDLAVFPGTHSVLWEQAVASGLPAIFKYWKGMDHVDVGGNCLFLYRNNPEELFGYISRLILKEDEYKKMKEVAMKKGTQTFSYIKIAKRSIER